MTILPRVGSALGCCGTLVVAGLVAGGSADAASAPPADATPVHITAGTMTSGIDDTLERAHGSISGRVLESGSGKPLKGVWVSVGSDGGVQTGADGRYRFPGLPPSRTGYQVCFDPTDPVDSTSGGRSTTGWAPECYRDVPWAGDAGSGFGLKPVAGAAHVRVRLDEHVTGINARLGPAAAITGTVRSQYGRVNRADVRVRSVGAPYFDEVFYEATGPAGRFTVSGLPPAAGGYRICFDPHRSDAYLRAPAGLVSHRHRSHGSSVVHLRPGKLRTGVDADLRTGGAISGNITNRFDGTLFDHTDVAVYDRSGRLVGTDATGSNGHYIIDGLPAAKGDRVCAATRPVFTSEAYQRTCSRSVPWTGSAAPPAAAEVSVVAGAVHRGVDVQLRRGPSISGTITSASTHEPVWGVEVSAFDRAGRLVLETPTRRDGSYQLRLGLPSGTGYLVCAEAFSTSEQDPNGAGLAPRCASGASWDGARQDLPSDATYLPLAAHQDRGGVDIELPVGGGISGTLTALDSHRPVADADAVVIFDNHGHVIAEPFTDKAGRYSVTGLDPAHAYRVCFPRSRVFLALVGSECYHDVPWPD